MRKAVVETSAPLLDGKAIDGAIWWSLLAVYSAWNVCFEKWHSDIKRAGS